MNTIDKLRLISLNINKQHNLSIELHFKSDAPGWLRPVFDRADFFCLPDGPGGIGYIGLNDDLFPDLTYAALVNILCHEYGHILDDFNTPYPSPGTATLANVVAFERAANTIGERLFNQYMPGHEYWHNHLDLERMESSTRFYNGASTHKPGLPESFYKRETIAAH